MVVPLWLGRPGRAMVGGVGVVSPWDPAAGVTGGLAAQAWQAAMLGLWNAGLWLLGLVLRLEDALLTPDLSADGPAAGAYGLTLWLAGALGVVMLLGQLLVTLLRRDARSLGAALLGCGKFVVVWAGWAGWAAAVVSACGGLTRAVLAGLLHVRSFAGWHPALTVSAEQAVDATVATVLGLLGLVLWLAALGHVLVMLGRAVTLLVLAATTPVAAAGLVGEVGRAWFWRSVRWFHAAALTPLLMALLLGVGVQVSAGVSSGAADGAGRAVASALPGVLLILASCFAPVALFRLLAFVEPATPAGHGLRQALGAAAQTGLLLGAPGRWPGLPGAGDQDRDAADGGGGNGADGHSSSWGDADDGGDAGRRGQAEQGLSTAGSGPAVGSASASAGGTPSAAVPAAAHVTGAQYDSHDASHGAHADAAGSEPTPAAGSTGSFDGLDRGLPGFPPGQAAGPGHGEGAGAGAGPGQAGGVAGESVAGEAAALPVVPL